MWLDIGIVLLYLAVLVGMGLRGGRQVKSAGDFTASGGRYGTLVLFASLSASFIGGGYSSGNAARAFENGIGTTLALFGFSLAMILIGRFIVPGVGRFSGVSTAGGVIGRAYGRRARVLSGLFIFLCSAGMVGAQMEAIGLVFHVLLGVKPLTGVLIGFGIVLVYSTAGGLQSVIAADMVQFTLLAVGMPLLLVMSLLRAGGAGAVLDAVPDAYFNPFNGTTPAAFFSLFLTMMLGEALAPPYTQRLLIGRSPRSTAKATILSGLFSIPFFVITGLIGLSAYALLTGLAAVAVAFAVPDIFDILVLAYSFWCPLILVPLAAAFLGIRSDGRAFRTALLAGLLSTLVWNYLLHRPFGIDGAVVGTACNLLAFSLRTRQFRRRTLTARRDVSPLPRRLPSVQYISFRQKGPGEHSK